MSLTIDVINTKGEKGGTVSLPESVFEAKGSKSVVHEVVTAYQANTRRGTHSTKTRGEVSGGGIKPWKQKHTGNARAGSIRSPLWRHGGIIFGPKPRSYVQDVPPAKRRLALRLVLTDYAKTGRLTVIENFEVNEPKTKKAAELVAKLNLPRKSIVVVENISDTLNRAVRNLSDVVVVLARDLNSYTVLLADRLVLTKGALEQLTKRLEGGANS